MKKSKNTRRGLSSVQKSRAAFRHSDEWSDFRLQRIDACGSKCTCCGMKYQAPKLQLHHKSLDPARYEILDNVEDFAVLCSTCHRLLHALQKKVHRKTRAYEGIPELKILVQKFFI